MFVASGSGIVTSLDLTVRIATVGSTGASQPVPNVPLAQWSVAE